MNPQETFLNLLIAAMKDAVTEGKMTQLQCQIKGPNNQLETCRIIVVPEKLSHSWPLGAPAGTPTS